MTEAELYGTLHTRVTPYTLQSFGDRQTIRSLEDRQRTPHREKTIVACESAIITEKHAVRRTELSVVIPEIVSIVGGQCLQNLKVTQERAMNVFQDRFSSDEIVEIHLAMATRAALNSIAGRARQYQVKELLSEIPFSEILNNDELLHKMAAYLVDVAASNRKKLQDKEQVQQMVVAILSGNGNEYSGMYKGIATSTFSLDRKVGLGFFSIYH
jgi:hypothetical protein